MAYAEPLPLRCPPPNAADVELVDVFRLVEAKTYSPKDFASHQALEKENKGNADACLWASCSLVRDPRKHIATWPRLRASCKFALKLTIPVGSGKSLSKKLSNHIHFWAYAGFDTSSKVTGVVPLTEVEADV
jgi:hypothetical protein